MKRVNLYMYVWRLECVTEVCVIKVSESYQNKSGFCKRTNTCLVLKLTDYETYDTAQPGCDRVLVRSVIDRVIFWFFVIAERVRKENGDQDGAQAHQIEGQE